MLTFIKHVIFKQVLQNFQFNYPFENFPYMQCQADKSILFWLLFRTSFIDWSYIYHLKYPRDPPPVHAFLLTIMQGVLILLSMSVCVCVCVCVCVFLLGYLVEFMVTGLILFAYDSGAIPRGHRLVRRITTWC